MEILKILWDKELDEGATVEQKKRQILQIKPHQAGEMAQQGNVPAWPQEPDGLSSIPGNHTKPMIIWI